MSDITYKDVLNKVIELGKADPDFVYSNQPGVKFDGGCHYLAGNEAGEGRPCIVGQALLDLGIPAEHIEKFKEDYAEFFLPQVLGLDTPVGSTEESDALNAINTIQYAQDVSVPWGLAVEDYLIVAP